MSQVGDQHAFARLESLLEHGIADRITQFFQAGAGGRRGPDDAVLFRESLEVQRFQAGREVRLVDDENRRLPPRQIQEPPVLIAERLAPVEHRQNQLGARQRVMRAAHALALHHVHGLPQARRVQQAHGNAPHVDELLEHVARRAWNRGHDRPVRLHQRIHETGLAHIGTPDQHRRDAFPDDAPFLRRADELRDPIAHHGDAIREALRGNERDVFVREVDPGFNFDQQAHQAFAQTPEFLRQGAAELLQRNPQAGLGTGRNQVHDRLGLREIESAVQEGALREFPRLGEPRAAQEEGLHPQP